MPRVLPPSVKAVIDASTWQRPALFQWLQKAGNVADGEMHRVFNCGIGMCVVVAEQDAEPALAHLRASGEAALRIGRIEVRRDGEAPTLVV